VLHVVAGPSVVCVLLSCTEMKKTLFTGHLITEWRHQTTWSELWLVYWRGEKSFDLILLAQLQVL